MSTSISFESLPREIIYSIFEYLKKEDIAYGFLELNNYFSALATHFIGQQFDLTKINDNIIFQHCLSTVLPSIGSNLRYLSIGHPYCLFTYLKSLKTCCTNLDTLNIYCSSKEEDIRLYVAHLLHHQLESLTFLLDDKIVGEHISHRLLNKSVTEQYSDVLITANLNLHLSSSNDLILLKRYSESSYLSNGFYMIECASNGEWLTDSKDDLCLMSNKVHREHIFFIKQINNKENCLEYEIFNEQNQRRLSVLTCENDEEYWIPSSVLSTQRKESNCSCSTFTFEKIDNENQYYIRPCFANAKRLQVLRKHIIVSLCQNESLPNHCFKLHRVS